MALEEDEVSSEATVPLIDERFDEGEASEPPSSRITSKPKEKEELGLEKLPQNKIEEELGDEALEERSLPIDLHPKASVAPSVACRDSEAREPVIMQYSPVSSELDVEQISVSDVVKTTGRFFQ